MTQQDRYGYWLDGEHNAAAEYIFRYLVDHQVDIKFEVLVDEQLIRVDVPWQPFFTDKSIGIRQYFLDPEKGFFPVRGYGRWERTRSNGKLSWRREEFFADEPKLVGDVWMPMKLTEIIGASTSQAPNIAAIYETDILQIEHGTVSPDDLIVPFKDGMKVVDAIEGTTYLVGKDGTPQADTVERVIGADAITAIQETDQERQPSSKLWLVFVNIGVLVIVAVVYFLRRRTMREAQ